MLEITIMHESNNVDSNKENSVWIDKIELKGKELSRMEDGIINLDVAIPYIGEEILIKHIYGNKEDYTINAILKDVELDKKTYLKSIVYTKQ